MVAEGICSSTKTRILDAAISAIALTLGSRPSPRPRQGTIGARPRCTRSLEVVMPPLMGMILGMLLLIAGVYTYDSMTTSTVASGQVAQANRTIVNWDVGQGACEGLK